MSRPVGSKNVERGQKPAANRKAITSNVPEISLTPRGEELISEVESQWHLDAPARRMLRLAAEALSVSETLHNILEREGWHYVDRFGCPKPHPLGTLEGQARTSAANILAKLRLDLG